MSQWYMLAVVGKDKPGIVAEVTDVLFQLGCNLGEASMTRLGDSFAIMLMVSFTGLQDELRNALVPKAQAMGLSIHLDPIEGGLHHHIEPNVAIRVFGADRAGIVAQVTHAMAELDLNITSLETEVAGTEEQPLYIMLIEARSNGDINQLKEKIKPITDSGYEVSVSELDLMLG